MQIAMKLFFLSTAKPFGGESPADCVRRSVPAMERLLDTHHQNIVIVAHGRLLRIILAYLTQGTLVNMHSFRHHNTSVNVLDAFVGFDERAAVNYNDDNNDAGMASFTVSSPIKRHYSTIQTERTPLPLPKFRADIRWIPWVLDDTAHAEGMYMVQY